MSSMTPGHGCSSTCRVRVPGRPRGPAPYRVTRALWLEARVNGGVREDVPVLNGRPGGREMLPPDARDLTTEARAGARHDGVLAAARDDLAGAIDLHWPHLLPVPDCRLWRGLSDR